MSSLTFSYGTMNCGKSTLALQMDYNLEQAGKKGKLFTRLDRNGQVISSRLGLEKSAEVIDEEANLFEIVKNENLDYIIVDEVQFFSKEQIDQLGAVVDDLNIDVYCYGISSDFKSCLFEGSKRLFEIADSCIEMQLKAMCWCGQPGRVNARVVNSVLVYEGDQVVVGDMSSQASVHYVLLCRKHYRQGKLD